MLDRLLGSLNKERALVFLMARDRGYAREIARFFQASLSPLQKALDALEAAGVLVSRPIGRAREYEFNPLYPALVELKALVERALELYPANLRDELPNEPQPAAAEGQAAVKEIADLSAEELAGLVSQTLRDAGITVTLTGGGCVVIWSQGKYVSNDLDFIEEGPVPRRKVQATLETLGFMPHGRHFAHPQSKFFVEFPNGPLMVGKERIETVAERETSAGLLRLLSPTDCVKDRLAAYFHWNDRQALEQALLVAHAQEVDLADVRRWSVSEDEVEKFDQFAEMLRSRRVR